MDSQTVLTDIEYFGTSGIGLTPQIRAALQTSLPILKANNKFNKVTFWGRVEGISGDYYIAQGFVDDLMRDRKMFYSSKCVSWNLLPEIDEVALQSYPLIFERFLGDPSYEYEIINKVVGEEGENEKVILIKEEDRLRALIKLIDDIAIVPRGAYLSAPDKKIVKNRSFEGLTVEEATKFTSYFYFSDPQSFDVEAVAKRGDYEKAIDIFNSIENSVPHGSWTLQFERGNALVTLRNLLWPGYVFYNIPGSCHFGSLYWGIGQKNLDLPFML